MRTTITRVDQNTVKLRAFLPHTGDVQEAVYWVPPTGGYVRDVSDPSRPGTLGTQVCAGLSDRGNTIWSTPDALLDVIRAEWRRCRDTWRRLGIID